MPAIFSSGEFGSKLSSDPVKRDIERNKLKYALNRIRDQVDTGELKTGSKAIHEKLNELEKMGIATFGTGLRGRSDVAGGGDKSYTRSQLGRLRGALYDPSQRDFDEAGTQVAGQELSATDYENYLKGREERFRDTLLGKGIATLGGMFNPLGLAVKGAQDFLSPYLKFLQQEKPDYYGLLQQEVPQNRNNLQNRYAGILGLQVPQNMASLNNNVPAGALSGFQLASNPVNHENPVVNASNIINSNQLYPMLNYNYPIV